VNSIESDFELGQNLYTNANVQVHTHAFAFELDNRAICYAPSNRAFGLRYSTSDLDMLDSNSSCTRDGDESAYEEAARGEWSAEEGPLGREGELGEYDREQASHVKRLHEAPQWMWGRANVGKAKCTTGKSNVKTDSEAFQRESGDFNIGTAKWHSEMIRSSSGRTGRAAWQEISLKRPHMDQHFKTTYQNKSCHLFRKIRGTSGRRIGWLSTTKTKRSSVNNSPTTGFRRRRSGGRINCDTNFTTGNLEATGAHIFE
jgi:hypothetical protein